MLSIQLIDATHLYIAVSLFIYTTALLPWIPRTPFPFVLLLLLLSFTWWPLLMFSGCTHGCFKASNALTRFFGLNASKGTKKSENSWASDSLKWYFSNSTFFRLHGRKSVICFSSPFLLKKFFEYLMAVILDFQLKNLN